MARPTVDVIVPFRGERAELEQLRERLGRLHLREGDSVLVVDNTPGARPLGEAGTGVAVLPASERATPAYARNRGAAQGSADWLVFVDADVVAPVDLLDRYFDPAPAPDTGLLAGGIVDEPVPVGGPAAARYAYIRAFMSQEDTLRPGLPWGFPKTANAACRRSAFESVAGFRDDIRAAEDADLTFRLRAAGWELERREGAAAVHRSRQTVRGFVKQKLSHGAGAAWIQRAHPGSSPPRRLPGLVWWGTRVALRGLLTAARRRDRDRALWAVLEPLELVVHELGRSLPNERPIRARALGRAVVGGRRAR